MKEGKFLRRLLSLTLFLLPVAVVTLTFIPYGYANPNVYTAKEDGTITDTFAMGEKVRIIAYSSNPCPYEVVVTDSDGVVRFTDTSNVPNYDKVVTGITDKPGWWEVKAGTTFTHYGIALYNVIPEVPLGTLAAVAACFSALGLTVMQKRSKFNTSK